MIFILSGIISCFFGIKITALFNKKYQFYKIMHYRINKNGYSIECFECGVMDPCYRLLTKQILSDIGKREDYKVIIKNFGNTKRILTYKSRKIIEELNER
jgi:hypothetical protein